jgi:EAL and modified HD-GYP domain-containing signal transduction protein
MLETIFLGRQPILDRDQHVVAYELLFRASATAQTAVFPEVKKASIQVIATTFSSMGVGAVLGSCRGYFNIAAEVLMSDVLEALPCDRVALEILETMKVDEAVSQRCIELKEKGFMIALDDYVPDDPREAMLGVADLVKVDLVGLDEPALRALVRHLRKWEVQLLAEKVETREEFDLCRKLGFELFQGYFFARPIVLEGGALDSKRTALLELLQRVSNEDDQELVVETLKRNSNLSINLLKLVNSVAMPSRTTISRIEDALRYLGRRQLQRWVTILLFAGEDNSGLRSPLFSMASRRGRLMELIIERSPDGKEHGEADRAFLVGMLSLADVLLSRPIGEVTAELNLDSEVEAALLEHEGAYGRLLQLVERIEYFEQGDYDRIAELLAEFGLEMRELQELDTETYSWIHGLVDEQAP